MNLSLQDTALNPRKEILQNELEKTCCAMDITEKYPSKTELEENYDLQSVAILSSN